MSSQNEPPLDERQFRQPAIIHWWVNSFGGQPMDENMIHRYLAESPFFDHTTKNGLTFQHARVNEADFNLVKDRRAFEAHLKAHVGSEFMIVDEPQQVPGAAAGMKNGMWVIRKQDRARRREADGNVVENLTTLGTYYIVGENLYQAPSVGDIVGNRLMSAATSLSKFFDIAADLPSFSPTAGYSYLPQSSQHTAMNGSAHASPSRSREGSVVPGADTQSLRSSSLAPTDTHMTNHTNPQDARLLVESFRMAIDHADDYMDENPLIGEPGDLKFTHTVNAVKKRKAADEEAAALAAKAKAASSEVKVEKPPSPPAVMTATATMQAKDKEREKERRGSKMGRRKKSRANVGSLVGVPETPAG